MNERTKYIIGTDIVNVFGASHIEKYNIDEDSGMITVKFSLPYQFTKEEAPVIRTSNQTAAALTPADILRFLVENKERLEQIFTNRLRRYIEKHNAVFSIEAISVNTERYDWTFWGEERALRIYVKGTANLRINGETLMAKLLAEGDDRE